MTQSKPKYRPSLSEEEVQYILLKAKEDYIATDSPISLAVVNKFSVLATKIANNAITPSHVEKPKVSLIESLGGTQPSLQVTKEEYWAQCYAKYELDSTSCTVAEIKAAQEHRYLNDLMTPDEVARHEAADLNNL
jgi:hypothetical protein